MPTFNFYSAWMDPVFYAWSGAALAALVGLIYSIRRYLELKNAAFDDALPETAEALPDPVADQPAAVEAPVQPELSDLPAVHEELTLPAEEPASAAPAGAEANRAETFVRGIYEGISGLDARMKALEASLSKSRVNNDFTVKFLEDILADMDSLDKVKLKARIEYLLSDLKK
jgi:hypothetical protein